MRLQPLPHLLPILSILLVASFIVSNLTVDEQDGKVDHVEVRDRRGESAWKTPCPTGNAKKEARRLMSAPPAKRRRCPITYAMIQSPR
jgi:hypothetical protein